MEDERRRVGEMECRCREAEGIADEKRRAKAVFVRGKDWRAAAARDGDEEMAREDGAESRGEQRKRS